MEKANGESASSDSSALYIDSEEEEASEDLQDQPMINSVKRRIHSPLRIV